MSVCDGVDVLIPSTSAQAAFVQLASKVGLEPRAVVVNALVPHLPHTVDTPDPSKPALPSSHEPMNIASVLSRYGASQGSYVTAEDDDQGVDEVEGVEDTGRYIADNDPLF